MSKYDFCGWATKNDIPCEDGLVITKNAFMHQDGETVPLVWQHNHSEPKYIIGSALLKNVEDGVKAFCTFNKNEAAWDAKEAVCHGDITRLSICAKVKKHEGNYITQGKIKEVSLVISGANPGATIEEVSQSEDGETLYVIDIDKPGLTIFEHADDETDEKTNPADESDENEKTDDESTIEQSDSDKNDGKKKTIKEILETLNDEQAAAVGIVLASLTHSDDSDSKSTENSKEEEKEMQHSDKYNVFEKNTDGGQDMITITHSDEVAILQSAKDQYHSFARALQAFMDEHQIQHDDEAHPVISGNGNVTFGWNADGLSLSEYHANPLKLIDHKDTGWIGRVSSGVTRSPFSKVKMTFADITEEDARARGYIKGNYKYPQVYQLSQRTVSPTNVIAKQQANQEDIDEIEDFSAVNMINQVMDVKLREEQARAILFGDGRDVISRDKINESCIIPAYNDNDLFTIKKTVVPGQNETQAHAFIQQSVRAQDEYQGSGSTLVAFVKTSLVTDMLLEEDKQGRKLYKSITEVAMAMGVDVVVRVPAIFMPAKLLSLTLDLRDYGVGYSRLGKTKSYESFDIDYNVHKYLKEVRMSGALTTPYSAIAISEQ